MFSFISFYAHKGICKLPAVAVSCYQLENASETVFLGLKVQIQLEIVDAYKKDGSF